MSLPLLAEFPGRNWGRIGPQTALGCLGVMLHDVEIVIPGIAAVYPRHAALDLFGVRVHTGTLDAGYRPLVSVLDPRQNFRLLAKAEVRQRLLCTSAVWLMSLWRIDLCQSYLHFLLLIGQNGKSIAVGYANHSSEECFSLSHCKLETAYCCDRKSECEGKVWHLHRGKYMADLSMFEHYYKLADMLIEKATKEEVAECARLLRSI
jgi:hypothetical protein